MMLIPKPLILGIQISMKKKTVRKYDERINSGEDLGKKLNESFREEMDENRSSESASLDSSRKKNDHEEDIS